MLSSSYTLIIHNKQKYGTVLGQTFRRVL
uniref:Uncharacterized protein n=1 Tax=Anguilla anguilla TaxID=7936 RepID=A0A0E9SA75_ANGAN